jgi:hypothetical protein
VFKVSRDRVDGIVVTKREQERQAHLAELCQDTILGIGTVNIREKRTRIMLRTFNPTRTVQKDIVRNISKNLEAGHNRAAANPLVIAVDPAAIDSASLETSYDTFQQTPTLSPARFHDPQAKLEVLSGFHRVSAAREAMESLQDRMDDIKKQIKSVDDCPEESGNGTDSNLTDEQRACIASMESEFETLKGLQRSAQVWPVWFYDSGKYQSL